ncbi:MAG: signal peptidase I [Oscillospiraceae bacterium]|nr:signal peptidase I [Oscillospiraceae bacterium]
MKFPRAVKKIWDVATTVIVILVVIFAMLLVGVRLFGIQVYTVLSGSMEPVYHVGSLIYVKQVDPFELKSGDVITFMLDEDTIATHRIVGVVPDEEDPTVIRFRTKGDANDAEDATLVHYKNVVGSPVFTIPKLGYLSSYIQKPPGMYIAIAAGAILLILVFLPDLFKEDKKEEKGEESHVE